MPTYVYECSRCQDVFEVEQRITEEPLRDCACGASGSVKRLIQPVGIAFKGAGFHVNDYAGSKPSGGATTSETDAKAEPAACSGEPASCARCAPEAESN